MSITPHMRGHFSARNQGSAHACVSTTIRMRRVTLNNAGGWYLGEELLNKVFIFVFFGHKKYSSSFIALWLNHWCHMDCVNDVLTTFLVLHHVSCIAVNGGSESFHISSKISSFSHHFIYIFCIVLLPTVWIRSFLFIFPCPLSPSHFSPSIISKKLLSKKKYHILYLFLWHSKTIQVFCKKNINILKKNYINVIIAFKNTERYKQNNKKE